MRPLLLAALALVAAACAPRFDPRLVDVPIAGRRWVSTEQIDHPLVGRIWDPRGRGFVDEATLDAAVTSADFVALGEVHDNPDHHLLQARLLRAIVAAGRRPALAFEMLDADQQASIDASVAAAPRNPDALGKAVRWDRSGWPEYRWYRPIFDVGLEAGLPIVAAGVSRSSLKELRSKGREALDEEIRTRLARDEPIPEATLRSLREEMNASHCGLLPESALDPLVLGQRVRDARMAERMETSGSGRGAVLVAGSGHGRNDRGATAVLARDAPGMKIVSVAFFEVSAGQMDPASYHLDGEQGPAPFDFLVFTPGAAREDPCAGMRAHMKKHPAAPAKEGSVPPPANPAPEAPPQAPSPPAK